MFAQSNPDALQIGLWVLAATAVLQAVGAALAIARFVANRAERRQVTISADAVGRPDFDAHLAANKQEHESLFARIGGVERGAAARLDAVLEHLRTERAQDLRAIHAETNQIGKELGALKAVNELQTQRLAAIDAKLDRVIERQTI
jgi:cob(I)alamin adenosyltransferase